MYIITAGQSPTGVASVITSEAELNKFVGDGGCRAPTESPPSLATLHLSRCNCKHFFLLTSHYLRVLPVTLIVGLFYFILLYFYGYSFMFSSAVGRICFCSVSYLYVHCSIFILPTLYLAFHKQPTTQPWMSQTIQTSGIKQKLFHCTYVTAHGCDGVYTYLKECL